MALWLTQRSQEGLTTIFDDRIVEIPTCTCKHCNAAFQVPVGLRPEDIGGMCPGCFRPVCPCCYGDSRFNCVPFEEKLNRYERAMNGGPG